MSDIVGLQELSALVAEQIDLDLADRYPYRYLLPAPHSYGLGLLSRYPIIQQRLILPLSAQQVVVDVEGMQVTVLNVHMPSPEVPFGMSARIIPIPQDYTDTRRARMAPSCCWQIDAISGPLIALGDFNTSEREPLYDQIAARLQGLLSADELGDRGNLPSAAAPGGPARDSCRWSDRLYLDARADYASAHLGQLRRTRQRTIVCLGQICGSTRPQCSSLLRRGGDRHGRRWCRWRSCTGTNDEFASIRCPGRSLQARPMARR